MKVALTSLALTFAGCLIAAASANAADYEIKQLNKGADGMFVFEPSFLKIASGDTVHFKAQDKGHDVESVKGMIPAGAEPFTSGMNKDLSVTFTVPGVYGIACKPHYGMGMVGLIQVGDVKDNLAEAKEVHQPGKAKAKFDKLFAELGG
ncbi:MAG: pseudoazurin [Azospirillum sp.]|nr:pseudoazurin [Azospirillum sp.]